jgi:hypothetical protein
MTDAFSCNECRKHWGLMADGEIDVVAQAAVHAHLRECSACATYFARERAFEEGLRAKLSATYMPDEMWDDLETRVRANRRVRRLPLVWPVALAASIMLAALVSLFVMDSRKAPAPDGTTVPVELASASMVDLLQKATPELVRFQAPAQSDVATSLDALSKRMFGREVFLDAAEAHGHPLELISVREAADADGNAYLEVRVNCCGRPVLLALTACGAPCDVPELQRVTAERKVNCPCRQSCGKPTGQSRDVRCLSIDRNGIRIAAAAAGHTPDAVLDAIQIKA